MAEFAIFTYGMLATFVLSGASRNKKLQRRNPAVLEYIGYLLCGVSAGVGVLLLGYAAVQSLG